MMCKKIILLLIICGISVCGFAQKSKSKLFAKAPKSVDFEMLINGSNTPADRYCPLDTLTFDFRVINSNINMDEITYCWKEAFHRLDTCNVTPIKLPYPLMEEPYKMFLIFDIPTDTTIYKDTLITVFTMDYIRTKIEETVCEGRDITITTNTHGDITFTDVHGEVRTPWDTLQSVSGCDSLVCWVVTAIPYITEEYNISSCDSVIWGDIIVRRPPNEKGDYVTNPPLMRIFFAKNPDMDCDTLKILTVTIIDTSKLEINFDPAKFCEGDDTSGSIELETNFTAFDWRYFPDEVKHPEIVMDTTVFEPILDIEYSGYYYVTAYMDTSLYEILTDLRIVNCSLEADTLVEDCKLIIPNVITPNDDGVNDVLGIKKLNPDRENELTIYDRWGKNIFQQKNYKCVYKNKKYLNPEDAFAGVSRGGQNLPDGVYYYAFKYDAIPKATTYTGTLTILR